MVEFAINSNISSSTGFAPFELNYGYMPMFIGGITPIDNAKPGVKQFVNLAIDNLEKAHDAIIKSRVTQMRQANKRRQEESPIAVGDKMYLSTENLVLPKGRSRKLMPKFIGPYPVTKIHLQESRYDLDLPAELKARRIHPSFHISRLRHSIRTTTRSSPRGKSELTMTSAMPKTMSGWWVRYSPTSGTRTVYCSWSNGILEI